MHDATHTPMVAKPYWNPYKAGVLLGFALLAAFLLAGQGLGASAFPKRLIALWSHGLAPAWTERNSFLGHYVSGGVNPLRDWLMVEVVAVMLAGFLAAVSAGRFKVTVEKGPNISVRGRLSWALTGGIVMGFAAALARGCTSGQALSGGALLATGSWVFMLMVFAGGYLGARFMRRQWT